MFVLDCLNDTVVRLVRYDGCNELRFPKEALDFINKNEWIWEIYFDNVSFDDTTIFREGAEFVAQISDDAMQALGWQYGDEVSWTLTKVQDGAEMRVVKQTANKS